MIRGAVEFLGTAEGQTIQGQKNGVALPSAQRARRRAATGVRALGAGAEHSGCDRG